MRLLGIDFGTKRIGIALSDEGDRFALPYSVIANGKGVINEIKKICERNNVKKIILGRSVDYKGQPNPVMKRIESFKKRLEREIGLTVFYEEETLSTKEAEEIQGRVKKIDASAAAIILRSFMERNKMIM